MKNSIDLTTMIAKVPYHKEHPPRVGAWASFWIPNLFWMVFVILICGAAWSFIELGTIATKKLIETRRILALLEEERAKAIAEREDKISRLMAYHSASSSDIIAMAKTIQEIYETSQNRQQARFLDEVLPEALRIQVTEGIPASACVSMAIYESHYGESQLARDHHNYFGLKAFSNWDGKKAEDMATRDSGVRTTADFRSYVTIAEGFDGYAEFIRNAGRYDRAFRARNGVEFVSHLLRGGYCPDSNYLDAIRTIMNRHKLDKLDSFQSDQMARRNGFNPEDAS